MYEVNGISKRGNYCVTDNTDKTFISKHELRLLLLNDIKVQGAILDENLALLVKKSVKDNIVEEKENFQITKKK